MVTCGSLARTACAGRVLCLRRVRHEVFLLFDLYSVALHSMSQSNSITKANGM